MVAPVYTDDDFRRVYFPSGDWMDFDTHEIHRGPKTIERYDAPLARIPVLVRISREVSAKLLRPLLNEQWSGFKKRCDYYLEIRGKFLRPQPFDRMKKQVDMIEKVKVGDAESSRRAIGGFAAFIEKEETEGSMPFFTAKNLRERIRDIDLSLRALQKLENLKLI